MCARILILCAAAAVAAIVIAMLPPMPQDLAYHDFADIRPMAFMPNWQNVLSNIPFLLIGLAGMRLAWQRHNDERPSKQGDAPAWFFLFTGVFFTAFGSAYYHWAPSNETLLWDRLPMAVGFMAFFAAVISERISEHAYRSLIFPLLAIGIASVLYWYFTERYNVGDLRPYIFVQFFPLLAIPLMMVLFSPKYTHGHLVVCALLAYLGAKLLEFYDVAIYDATNTLVSGHALKHLAAALGCWLLLRMYQVRQYIHTGRPK